MSEWSAPRARGLLRARVELPGSKSLTNRALVLAALADGPSRIVRPLRARDTELMANALRTLGTAVELDGPDWVLRPGPLGPGSIDVGLAGTVMRFVPPLAALADGPVHFDGDLYARERPMSTLLQGLRQAGVRIEDEERGRLPFTVHGRGAVSGGRVQIDASASSQFISGLLLCGARYEKGIEVVHTGAGQVPSQPHIDMTVTTLAEAGVEASTPEEGVWQVAPGRVQARDWTIEPDLSNAAPFLAAALVAGGSVTVPRWPATTTQAGDALRSLLAQMGASVSLSHSELTVTGRGNTVRGVNADLRDAAELVPTVAALAALAGAPSQLTGIGHLRGHETDRLAALATELARVGCEVTEQPDSLVITPGPLHGATWHAYADHRMATAGALLGLAVDGIVIDDIDCTSKTLPDFARMWTELVGS